MLMLRMLSPRKGDATLVTRLAEGEVAPADADVRDEDFAREVFDQLMGRGAIFDVTAPEAPVQLHEFPPADSAVKEMLAVPNIAGGSR